MGKKIRKFKRHRTTVYKRKIKLRKQYLEIFSEDPFFEKLSTSNQTTEVSSIKEFHSLYYVIKMNISIRTM